MLEDEFLTSQISVAQPKGVGRARASVSEPLRAYAIGKIATGKLRAGPAHGIPVAILPGPEACGLETAGLLLISSCLINRLALEACASLATRNACSGVLDRLGPNPGRRQAFLAPAIRLCSWVTPQPGQRLRTATAEAKLVQCAIDSSAIERGPGAPAAQPFLVGCGQTRALGGPSEAELWRCIGG